MKKKPLVVITRAKADSKELRARLLRAGACVYSFPTIKIVPQKVEQIEDTFDFVIFTSVHAVKFLKQKIKAQTVVAVGPQTKEELLKRNIKAVTPKEFSAAGIMKSIGNVRGKKILIVHSVISDKSLEEGLTKKGARVRTVSPYTTVLVNEGDKKFESLLEKKSIDAFVFMSPSSVSGFKKRVKNSKLLAQAHVINAVAIGDTTAEALRQEKFKKIHIARPSTTEGVVQKVKQSIRITK